MAQLSISLLGDFQVNIDGKRVDNFESVKVRALLAFLVVEADKAHRREQLAGFLWPEQPETRARRNLSQAVYNLRKVLRDKENATPYLNRTGGTISVNPASDCQVDVVTFSDLIQQCERHSHAGIETCSACSDRLRRAVGLYRGDFLAGFSVPSSVEYEKWLLNEQQRYERIYLATLVDLIRLSQSKGDLEAAVDYSLQYLIKDELAEDVHRQLISIYASMGDRAAAMRQFETCVSILERELGISPLPETRAALSTTQRRDMDVPIGGKSKISWTLLPSQDIPFIGRDDSVRQLDKAQTRLANGGIILISGEAGVGKTRLLKEFTGQLPFTVLVGSCHLRTESLPYQPLIQALRMALERKWMWEKIPPIWLSEVNPILPEIGDHFLELPQTVGGAPEQSQARMFEALTRIFFGLAAHSPPLILCLDDLHWSDQATMGWINYVIDRMPNSELCLLATFRMEEEKTLENLRWTLSRRKIHTEVALDGLSPESVKLVLECVSGENFYPESLVKKLHRATGGNPFYLLETLQALLETGSFAVSSEKLPLSESVQEAIITRVSRLHPVANQVLEAAAVLSPDLTFDLIRLTSGRDDREVVEGLEKLVEHNFLVLEASDHRFKHELIRAAVYQNMSPWRQRMLHRRAGDALGKVVLKDPDVAYAKMAYHYDVGEKYSEAIDCYQKAAEVAKRMNAHATSVAHIKRVIDLLPQTQVDEHIPATLLEKLGDSFLFTGELDSARQAYTDALDHNPLDNNFWRSELHRKSARVLRAQFRHDEAATALDSALTLLGNSFERSPEASRLWLDIQLDRLDVLYMQALPEAIQVLADQIEPFVKEFGDLSHQTKFLDGKFLFKVRQERYQINEEMVAGWEEVYRYSQLTGNDQDISFRQFGLGFANLWLGDLETAADWLNQSLELANKIGDIPMQNQCLAYITILNRLQGNDQLVCEGLKRLIPMSELVNHPNYLGVAWANQSWLAYRQGLKKDAMEYVHKAISYWKQTQTYSFEWLGYWILLAIAIEQSNLDTSLKAVEAMLNPIQQKLPDDIEFHLMRAVEKIHGKQSSAAFEYLTSALVLAKERHYL